MSVCDAMKRCRHCVGTGMTARRVASRTRSARLLWRALWVVIVANDGQSRTVVVVGGERLIWA